MNLQLENTWHYTGDERWDWEVSVVVDELSELDKIDKVKYVLHPTFDNPIRVCTNRSDGFKLKASGWGGFDIKAFVYLKDGEKLKMEHRLELKTEPVSGTSARSKP